MKVHIKESVDRESATLEEAILKFKEQARSEGVLLLREPVAFLQSNMQGGFDILVRAAIKPNGRTVDERKTARSSEGHELKRSMAETRLFGDGV
jgi:hypothetical protein